MSSHQGNDPMYVYVHHRGTNSSDKPMEKYISKIYEDIQHLSNAEILEKWPIPAAYRHTVSYFRSYALHMELWLAAMRGWADEYHTHYGHDSSITAIVAVFYGNWTIYINGAAFKATTIRISDNGSALFDLE